MSEIPAAEHLVSLVQFSLFRASRHLYRVRGARDLQYDGVRPIGGWHAHGFFPRELRMLENGEVTLRRIWKRRWLLVGTTSTCHSRPPDDLASVRSCSLIVVLVLWGLVHSAFGIHQRRRREVLDDLEQHPSPRTRQRWLRRALPLAMDTHQALRWALGERCEPQPVEMLFPSGLSPPEEVRRRPWKDLPPVAVLWQAFALVVCGAVALETAVAILLAEARGRQGDPNRPFVI